MLIRMNRLFVVRDQKTWGVFVSDAVSLRGQQLTEAPSIWNNVFPGSVYLFKTIESYFYLFIYQYKYLRLYLPAL